MLPLGQWLPNQIWYVLSVIQCRTYTNTFESAYTVEHAFFVTKCNIIRRLEFCFACFGNSCIYIWTI